MINLAWGISFGLALVAAVIGWVIAANKAGKVSVLENGMQQIRANASKIEEIEKQQSDDRVVHVEIKGELKSLRDGLRRIERTLEKKEER